MANVSQLLERVLSLADAVNEYLPAAPVSQLGIDLGKKVVDMIDDLKPHIPLDQQANAQARRKALADRVAIKARDEARKLRG